MPKLFYYLSLLYNSNKIIMKKIPHLQFLHPTLYPTHLYRASPSTAPPPVARRAQAARGQWPVPAPRTQGAYSGTRPPTHRARPPPPGPSSPRDPPRRRSASTRRAGARRGGRGRRSVWCRGFGWQSVAERRAAAGGSSAGRGCRGGCEGESARVVRVEGACGRSGAGTCRSQERR